MSINSILDAGKQHSVAPYLERRIRPTNVICLLVIFVLAIPFVIISLLYFPKMTVFPAGGGLISIIVIFINRSGGIYYSRVILPILLLVLSSLYNAFFSTGFSDGIVSVYLVELSFTIIPFVLFDYEEKGFLIFSGLFSLFILVVFPFFWSYLDMGYDGSELREGWLAVLTITLACISQLGAVTGLSHLNWLSEKNSDESLNKINAKNEEMQTARVELEKTVQELEEKRKAEQHRQWIVDGLTQVSDLIRQRGDEEDIFDTILTFLIKYLEANQGAIFLVNGFSSENEADRQLQLVACYAYGRKKYLNKVIEVGQGLTGQAYYEKAPLYFIDIPDDYVQISSGLGHARPRCLTIIPLINNEVVEGVLEIASFKPLEEHHRNFLSQLVESVASYISSNRSMKETRRLLLQSQEQGEELRAAEEEMRQNQEELQATQEEMTRRHHALEMQAKKQEEKWMQEKEYLQQIVNDYTTRYPDLAPKEHESSNG